MVRIEISAFEWDELKCETNVQKHGIDFRDAASVFRAEVLLGRSDREGEMRWTAIGLLAGREICVVFTERENVCRIISARRARKNERRAYRALLHRGN
jgi:uncharacterized DUF497 family protein